MKGLFICCLTLLSCWGFAQERLVPLPALTATVQETFTRTLADGNVVTKELTGSFYRDSTGRTRLERGHIVTINNPTERTIVVMDANARVAKRFVLPNRSSNDSMSPSMGDVAKSNAYQDLGTQIMFGVATRGAQFSVVVPPGAVGNLGPLTQTSEVWRSEELGIAVKTVSKDPLNGERTQVFKDIVKEPNLDSSLFEVPGDFQVVDIASEPNIGSRSLTN